MALYNMPLAIDYHERYAAFTERQRQVPETDRIPVCVVDPMQGEHEGFLKAGRELGEWMERWKPEVVMGFNGFFYWIIREGGWISPRDYEFYDLWIDRTPSNTPGFSLSREELGNRAVEYLDALIRGGERGIPDHPAVVSISLSWCDGPKTRSAKVRPPKQVPSGKGRQ